MTRKAVFVYRDAMSQHVLRSDHPMRPVRLMHTHRLLDAFGAFGSEQSRLIDPRPATDEEVGSFHETAYIEAVKALSKGERLSEAHLYNFSAAGDNPIYDGMYEAAMLSSGGSVVAAEMVASGQADTAFNIGGGLHHAAAGRASGFCIFNDPVIAINRLLSYGMKAAYVDIDVHHGDGVQEAFYDDPRVLTISVHESGRYLFPGTGSVEEVGSGNGRGYSVNLPLFPYTSDDLYLECFREIVPPLLSAFKPDVLVTQLGIDTYYNDPLAHLLLSSNGFSQVVGEFSAMGIPWLALGGGGYNVEAVARCWALAYGVMSEQEFPERIPEQLTETHSGGFLRDGQLALNLEDGLRTQARDFARASVEEVKRLIFPYHGL